MIKIAITFKCDVCGKEATTKVDAEFVDLPAAKEEGEIGRPTFIGAGYNYPGNVFEDDDDTLGCDLLMCPECIDSRRSILRI